MVKVFYILTLLLTTIQLTIAQEIPVPDNYTVIDTVVGDLDNDSIGELVVSYNHNVKPNDKYLGVPRELIIQARKRTVEGMEKIWTGFV